MGDTMGGRYLITGTELALLLSVSFDQRKEMLKEIEENRFIFDSGNLMVEDVRYLRNKLKE